MRIDLVDILKQKAPKMYNKMPRFVISILKGIVRQKRINRALAHCDGRDGIDFLATGLDYMSVNRKLYGAENIDTSKQYIFASNHPLGGLDGLAMLEQIDKVFRQDSEQESNVKIVVNDILMHFEPLGKLFIPINKFGRQSQSSGVLINESLSSGEQLILFPAGLCSRKINGKITDLEWKRTFVSKALAYKIDIIPLYVDNKNSWFFYFFALLRKKLGIKNNLEMLLLPSQMFGRKGKLIKIYCGKPISYESISSDANTTITTQRVREACYNLKSKYNGTNY